MTIHVDPPFLISRLYAQYRIRARNGKLAFTITFEQFKKLIKKDCYLCGDPPEERSRISRKRHLIITVHGLDRRDNSLGYTPDNVVTCCHTCNRIKSDFGLEFLKQHLAKMMKKVTND